MTLHIASQFTAMLNAANGAFSAEISEETFPLAGQFRIARGAKSEARVVTATVSADNATGHGECVPYARYGETVEAVTAAIKAVTDRCADIASLCDAVHQMPPGAARNAVDCALWDLAAKMTGERTSRIVCMEPPRPITTAVTISLDRPERMAAEARRHASRGLLKVKLGGDDDIACMHAVTANAPHSRIIVDANEGWSAEKLPDLMREAARLHIALIEQPLPAGEDGVLATMPHPVPICADESVHTSDDLDALTDRYDVVNIKLDKTGGLTEAVEMRDRARQLGFGVMVGCMVGSSLAMAPAVLLAQDADYVDLDGPLLLARDREHRLTYSHDTVSPPSPALWG